MSDLDRINSARQEIEKLNAEVAKLENLSSAYEEDNVRVAYQAGRSIAAQNSVNVAMSQLPTASAKPPPPSSGPRPPPRRSSSGSHPDSPSPASAPPPPPRRAVLETIAAPDPVLEEAIVMELSTEGWPIDSAIAAVKAIGAKGASVTAARKWLLQHQGGSGIRGVRALRRLVDPPSGSTAEQEHTPTKKPSKNESPGSSLPGSHNSRGSLTSVGSAEKFSRESSGSLRAKQLSLPWVEPSPTKRSGGEVVIRVRVLDGSVVELTRKFHPLDSLRSVMHELMRSHPLTPAPDPKTLSFVVPMPRQVYSWEQLELFTLEAARLCPRATVILQVSR